MKTLGRVQPCSCFVALVALVLSSVVHAGVAAELKSKPHASPVKLTDYPKNLARLHLGASLERFDPAARTYTDTQGAGKWLDDDEATGWKPSKGEETFLLSLPEASLITGFMVSAAQAPGKISVYTADERSAPESSSWNPLLEGVAIETVNEKVFTAPISRYARYLLIRTELEKPAPLWSLYVFGARPATAYRLVKRTQMVDTDSVYPASVNPNTVLDLASLYAGARVTYVNSGSDPVGWQTLIDESPETSWKVKGEDGDASLVIDFGSARSLRRFSSLIEPQAGVMEVFVLNSLTQPRHAGGGMTASEEAAEDGIQQISNTGQDLTTTAGPSLDRVAPVFRLSFDGLSDREAIEFAPVSGRYLLVRWLPRTAGDPVNIRQIDVFGDPHLADYTVAAYTPPVAKKPGEDGKTYQPVDYKSYKTFKQYIPPAVIAEGPPLDPAGIPFFDIPPIIPMSP